MEDKELREKIADFFAHLNYTTLEKARGTIGEFHYYKQADQILALIKEARKISGEPPIKVKLIVSDNKPAVEFEDGGIIFQSDLLADFLMHLSVLMPDCDLPDEFYISSIL